jgi:hypothetical protein
LNRAVRRYWNHNVGMRIEKNKFPLVIWVEGGGYDPASWEDDHRPMLGDPGNCGDAVLVVATKG